ncbi:MAG: hypothetical protein RMK20_06015, partial [Verrucomicrobiales bacterium]|nr:hypothetical protein [Verrucomicrobiales bacterium]
MEKFPEFLISKFETRAEGIEFGAQELRKEEDSRWCGAKQKIFLPSRFPNSNPFVAGQDEQDFQDFVPDAFRQV